jgi:AraC-like DNA-binding protein
MYISECASFANYLSMNYLEPFTYEVIFPDEGLKNFVSHFWFSRWNTGIQECFNYHSTASTNTELVFAFKPGRQPVFSTLQGHTANYCCIKTGGLSEMFGVSLYSHAIPYFFKVSACELIDQLLDLREIMRLDVEVITQHLAHANSVYKRVEIMTNFLKGKLIPNQKTDLVIINAIKKIRELRGQVNVQTLAKESALSQKQFERRFKNFSGFNPKLYSRIIRFERSLSPYNDYISLTDKALALGYYDQAHFINDFKQFSGFSPRNYTPVTL